MTTRADAQAFPDNDGICGLTKREYFAALAMQGILARGPFQGQDPADEFVAKWSVDSADALIDALNKEPVR